MLDIRNFLIVSVALVSLLVCTTSWNHIEAQECQGSFGSNSFVQGDFGRGNDNILTMNPGYAPGFFYTTTVPFNDGGYTITNNSGNWSNNWPTWLEIGDNSADPLGYMMVVNASFEPGIFYEQKVYGLCANTVYEVSFDVINFVKRGVAGHILPDVSLFSDGVFVLSTGPIQQDEIWHHFNFTFSNLQDSVLLTFRNNAPGGIGNDLALDNIAFKPCGPVAFVMNSKPGKICENSLFPVLSAEVADSDTSAGFQWQISFDDGEIWTNIPGSNGITHQVQQLSAGNYFFRYLWSADASNLDNPLCRIESAAELVEVVPIEFTIIDSLCEGLSFDLGGIAYSQTGVYTEHLTSSIGCDSIVTLMLTIVPDPQIQLVPAKTAPLCNGSVDGRIWLESILGGTAPFNVWSPGLTSVVHPDSLIVEAGTYDLFVTDRYGCSSSASVDVEDPEPFRITGLQDTTIILGHTIFIEPIYNYSPEEVIWQGQGLECFDCPSSLARPLVDDEFIVSATNENGCTASSSFSILVDREARIYCPNVFTPNGDGINDVWGVHVDPVNIERIDRIIIIDRWGTVHLDLAQLPSSAAESLWTGDSRGRQSMNGVYTYRLKYTLADGSVQHKVGTITLVR